MKTQLIVLLVLFFMNISLSSAEEEKYANIFLFDVTGSMEGRGDGMGIDIFNDVKDIAKRIIGGYSNDTYLVIIPFGLRVQEDNIFEIHIRSEADKEEAVKFIKGLEANEIETWLSYSLNFAINKLNELETKLTDFDERTQQLLLLTDGKGNGEGDLDEEGNFIIDNLIASYRVARTDYPHLYSRFFAVGDVLDQEKRGRLTNEGVDVTELGRGDVEIYTVKVSPQRIIIYDSNPSFELMFEPDTVAANNLQASISIDSEIADQAGSGFRISSPSFRLDEGRLFEVSIVNQHALETWMHLNDVQRVEGYLTLNADRLYFQPGRIRFEYAFEPVNIVFTYEDLLVKNQGYFDLNFENPTNAKIDMAVVIEDKPHMFSVVDYFIKPDTFSITGSESVRFAIHPVNEDKIRDYRREIKSATEGELLLSIIPLTSNVVIQDDKLSVDIIISPNRTILYLVLIAIFLLICLFFLWFFFFRPDFDISDKLVYSDTVSESLFTIKEYRKRKIIGNAVIIGNMQDIDVDLGDGVVMLVSGKSGVYAKVLDGVIQIESSEGKQDLTAGEKIDLFEANNTLFSGDKKIIFKQDIY